MKKIWEMQDHLRASKVVTNIVSFLCQCCMFSDGMCVLSQIPDSCTHCLLLGYPQKLQQYSFSIHFSRRWNKSARATTGVLCRSLGLAPKLWPTSITTLLVSTLQRTSGTSTQLWTKLKSWLQLMRPPASKISLKYRHYSR